jgi:hypothetical protein
MTTLREVLERYVGPAEEVQRRIDAMQEALQSFMTPVLALAEAAQKHITPERVAAWQAGLLWLNEMPREFQEALRGTGVIMHPDLSLHHVAEILETRKYAGRAAAAGLVLEFHDGILRESWYRGRLEERWKLRPRRWKVMNHALLAHDRGLYGASIPAAVAQAEGLVADIVRHKGRMHLAHLQRYIAQLAAGDDMNCDLIAAFVKDTLLAEFNHGQLAMPTFSRHAILHGADCDYATHANSVRALIWFDVLLHFDNLGERN